MAQNTKIEWCHNTANLWWGCTKVHAGCDNCYAEKEAHRWKFDIWGNDKPRRYIKGVWNDLKRWQQQAQDAGEIHRVFVGSMMDIFEKPFRVVDQKGNQVFRKDNLPVSTGDLRYELFHEVIPYSPNLMFLLLTKRPSNINKMIPAEWLINPPGNVMFGTSPVDQPTANTLIPQLLQVKGKLFISYEPALGPVNLNRIKIDPLKWSGDNYVNSLTGYTGNDIKDSIKSTKALNNLQWVIVGGESGGGKRPFDPEWARDVKSQCEWDSIPFFMKQIDKVKEIPKDLMIREFYK